MCVDVISLLTLLLIHVPLCRVTYNTMGYKYLNPPIKCYERFLLNSGVAKLRESYFFNNVVILFI